MISDELGRELMTEAFGGRVSAMEFERLVGPGVCLMSGDGEAYLIYTLLVGLKVVLGSVLILDEMG